MNNNVVLFVDLDFFNPLGENSRTTMLIPTEFNRSLRYLQCMNTQAVLKSTNDNNNS